MLGNNAKWHLQRSVLVRSKFTLVLHKRVTTALVHPVVSFRGLDHLLGFSFLGFHKIKLFIGDEV